MGQDMLSGATLGLAVSLALAAFLKLRARRSFEMALVRLVPIRVWHVRGVTSRSATHAIVVVESLTAAALLFGVRASAVAVTLWTWCLFVLFLGVRVRAGRRRVSCNCAGRASRPVTRSSIFSAMLLAVAAGTIAVTALAGADPRAVGPHPLISVGVATLLVLIAWPDRLAGVIRFPRLRRPRLTFQLTQVYPEDSPTEADGAPDAVRTLTRRRLLAGTAGAGLAGALGLGFATQRDWLAWACVPDPGLDHDVGCDFAVRKCTDCCGKYDAATRAQCNNQCLECWIICTGRGPGNPCIAGLSAYTCWYEPPM
jgi:hypothetical protein